MNGTPSWGFKWHDRIFSTQSILTIPIITIKFHTQTPPLVEVTMTTLSHLKDTEVHWNLLFASINIVCAERDTCWGQLRTLFNTRH